MTKTPLSICLLTLQVLVTMALACTNQPRPAPKMPAPEHTQGVAYYTCPMHPSVRATQPGACPICGMDLVKIDPTISGEAALQFDPLRLQKIGVKMATVVEERLQMTVRGEGRVRYDEVKEVAISVWVDGRVEQLLVSRVGQAVQRGQGLFRFYSPDLIAAQQELLAAPDSLRPVLRQRLLRLGMTLADVDAILAQGKVKPTVIVAAPLAGVIRRREVETGAAIAANMPAMTIAPSANIIVEAAFFEGDAAYVRRGDLVLMLSPVLPGQTWTGRIAELYPALDPETRALRARIEIVGDHTGLRPEAFVAVNAQADLGMRLTVPRDAIVLAGDRRVVFVDHGQGQIEPRDVQTGVVAGDRVEILSGLMIGETVVAAGTFLIASESRLRYATTFWQGVSSGNLGASHEH